MSDFNMFHGERVKYAGYHPFTVAVKVVVVGGDHHNIRVQWKVMKTLPPSSRGVEIVWLVDSGE